MPKAVRGQKEIRRLTLELGRNLQGIKRSEYRLVLLTTRAHLAEVYGHLQPSGFGTSENRYQERRVSFSRVSTHVYSDDHALMLYRQVNHFLRDLE